MFNTIHELWSDIERYHNLSGRKTQVSRFDVSIETTAVVSYCIDVDILYRILSVFFGMLSTLALIDGKIKATPEAKRERKRS